MQSYKTKAAKAKVEEEKSTKYMILELEECGNCVQKRRHSGNTYNYVQVGKQFAKVEIDKIKDFKIDTVSVQMRCPACNTVSRFNRIRWWGTGFEESSSIYSDNKEKKEVKVSDIRDVTECLLKHRSTVVKNDIKKAELNLKNLRKLDKSLKSIISKSIINRSAK